MNRPVTNLADVRRARLRQVSPETQMTASARPGEVVLEFTFVDGTRASAVFDLDQAEELAAVIDETVADARALADEQGGSK